MERLKKILAIFAALYAGASFGANTENTGVHLKRSTGNHLFAPVRINSQPGWFAVDTGAALTIVDSNKAARFRLTRSFDGNKALRSIKVNNRMAPVAQVKNLMVGSYHLGSGPVALINLAGFKTRFEQTGAQLAMDGILGLDILQRYDALIDCRVRKIYFDIQGTDINALRRKVKQLHFNSVPIRVTHSGSLEVIGSFGGRPYSFVVDTGGFATLVPANVAKENHIQKVSRGMHAKGIYASARPVNLSLAEHVSIGKYDLGALLVGVTQLPTPPEDLTYPFGGLLGADFLFEHSAIIDIGLGFLSIKKTL
jgi:predicted aspartyl protease